MARLKRSPGIVRDAIVAYLDAMSGDATVAEIRQAVEAKSEKCPRPPYARI